MNDAPNRSYYVTGTGSSVPVEISGAVVLKGIIAVPSENTPDAGSYTDFKDGGASGDVLYSLRTLKVSGGTHGTDAGAYKIDIPGSGMRFSSGLYYEVIDTAVEDITIIYQGGDPA